MGMGSFGAATKLNDGNVCRAGEEFFGGLCYKTCASLTNGRATNRISAMTCCEPVAGAGGCGDGEELFAGLCYKTCALLTDGKSPTRTSAFTCCSKANIKDCGVQQDHDLGMCS